MVCDLEHGHVLELAEGRSKESLLRCLGRFSINDSEVKAIAMDMWEEYASLLRAIVDDADDKIVFDRFHIVAHMNDAVNKIRVARTSSFAPTTTTGSSARSTCGSTAERTCPTTIPSRCAWSLQGCASRPRVRGRSKSRFATCGISAAAQRALVGELVCVDDLIAARAGEEGRSHDQASLVRRPELLQAPHYQRRQRSDQLGRADAKEASLRLRSFENFRTAVLFRCGGLDLYPTSHLKAG